MKTQSTLLCLVLTYSCGSFAQSIGPSALNSTGRSTTFNGITIEQSIGGIISGNTFESSGLIVTPGILQPKLSPPNSNGINDPKPSVEISVFPNPTEQMLFIQPGFLSKQFLDCTITDNLGRVLMARSFTLDKGNERQEINLSQLAASTYYLNLRWTQSNQDYTRSFKVQKTK